MPFWIIKMMGGACVVASGLLFSGSITSKMKSEIRFAEGLAAGFISLEEYVCGMLMPVEDALLFAADSAGTAREVFISASECKGHLKERFESALSENKEIYRDSICGFVQGICVSDEAERRTAFSIIRHRLSCIRDEAEKEYVKFGRLYNTAGISVGLIIALLLL